MSFLGDIGSWYMLILVALLIVGFGMIANGFLAYLLNLEKNTVKSKGVDKMYSGNWLKLSLYSLAGIIVSLLILSFVSTTGLGENTSLGNQSTASADPHAHGSASAPDTLGLSNINNTGNLRLNNTSNDNYYQLQQQLSQMQNQINQLQSLIQNLNSSQSTAPGATNSGSMPMMYNK